MPHDDAVIAARLRSLARLARPTAHELRGALNTLQLQVEVLAASAGDLPGGGGAGCLETIRAECQRVGRIAEAFLALAALPDAPGVTDLGGLVAGVIEAVRPLAAARRVRLDAPGCTPRLCHMTDPDVGRQRLLDALTDAVTDAPAGGTVGVEVSTHGQWARVRDALGDHVDVTFLDAPGDGDA
jgi:signal transduction histidine kinase